MDAAAIGSILAMVGAAIGFTDIAKKLVKVGAGLNLSPAIKRIISVVAGAALAAMTGVEIETVMPGGAALDGAIFGGLATAIIALINSGKKKP